MTDYFSYYDGSDVLPDGAIRISPSQLSKFFDQTSEWWRTQILGEDALFTGSTATHLGTAVHAAAHMYHETKNVDQDIVANYIDSLSDDEIDTDVIHRQWPTMATRLIQDFVSSAPIVHAERFVHFEIAPNIFVSGSIDAMTANDIIDYKTMGSLDKARVPTTFSRPYYFQQLTYAWILNKLGESRQFMKLVYVSRDNTGRVSERTGKPLKDYPSEVNILTEPITVENLDFIDQVLHLVADSIQYYQKNPDSLYLLAQDYRLKPAPVAPLFKD